MSFRGLLALLAATLVPAVAPVARADVQHVVGRGHTVDAIANRYHVPAKSIIDANHLKDVNHLKVGEVLTIPKAVLPPGSKAKLGDGKDAKDGKNPKDDGKNAKLGKPREREEAHPVSYVMKPKTPGVVHLKRFGTNDDLDIKLTDASGKVAASTLKTFEKVLRSAGGLAHPIDARLISLLGVMSNRFGSRKIEIVSGFRPYSPTQYTAHSNHNHGKAIDFRVVGVPNEVVRDFCRTLKNVGCGYYPSSTFVHLDVREKEAFWIDYSKPGEPPRYNAPNVDADEGTSDVHGASASTSAPPSDASRNEAPEPEEAPKTELPGPALRPSEAP